MFCPCIATLFRYIKPDYKPIRSSHLHILKINPEQHRDAVFEFLNYYKLPPKSPALSYLSEIFTKFAQIPYENISKIISFKDSPNWNTPIIRLPETVIAEHIDHHLGGTCFSLTFFLQAILKTLGYICYPVMADMRVGQNVHCCLIVLLDEVSYLVDPGYLLTKPMPFSPLAESLHNAEHAGVAIEYNSQDDYFDLYTCSKTDRKWRYRFHNKPVTSEVFQQHWLASFRRNSMHGLCLTKVMKNGVLFVNRTSMRETTFSEKHNFNLKKNYHQTLEARFGIKRQIVEQGQDALRLNLKRERDLGLWIPPQQTKET